MPVHLPACNRRRFLVTVGTGLVAGSVAGLKSAVQGSDADDSADLVYLLNDTHIGEKHPPDSAVPSNLRQAVQQILQMRSKTACVLINGDLALKDGQPGDYRHFAKLIRPLQDADVDLHLTLGNHDHRDTFYDVMADQQTANPPVNSRHVSVVETSWARFFLLDSLQKTMVTQGTIGELQLKWLTEALDTYTDRPAIIMAHHNPRLGGDPLHFPGGLIDSEILWSELVKRSHVKAYVHGHIHHRSLAQHKGIHIINTPAVSYVADRKTSTTGWTVASPADDGITLTTHCTDPEHEWHGQAITLKWRPDQVS
jgi:Icc-related predicted phosphoesterase